jgi:hypothetical protein
MGFGLVDHTSAKNKGGKKKKKGQQQPRCMINGRLCDRTEKQCQSQLCLHTPFTIEASWTSTGDQDAYLIVPAQDASTGPDPYLNFACNSGNSQCKTAYPYSCIDEDQTGPGDGVTTVHKLLPGRYEYWIQLHDGTAAGAVTIVLHSDGRVVQQWTNPANMSGSEQGWHVFDVDGARGSVTTTDQLINRNLPRAAVDPFTFVCTF